MGTGAPRPGTLPTAPLPTPCSLDLLTHTELAAEFINGADFCALNLPEGGFVLDQEPGTRGGVSRERARLLPSAPGRPSPAALLTLGPSRHRTALPEG